LVLEFLETRGKGEIEEKDIFLQCVAFLADFGKKGFELVNRVIQHISGLISQPGKFKEFQGNYYNFGVESGNKGFCLFWEVVTEAVPVLEDFEL